jgi:hypothetical protein
MNSPSPKKIKIMLQRIKTYFDETDIFTLVFIPPMLGFGGYFVFLFIVENLSEKPIPESCIYIGAGIASLITCIAGIAEIYKKEMPSSLGKVIKGNMALSSGIIIVVLFGFVGLVGLIYGINILISK